MFNAVDRYLNIQSRLKEFHFCKPHDPQLEENMCEYSSINSPIKLLNGPKITQEKKTKVFTHLCAEETYFSNDHLMNNHALSCQRRVISKVVSHAAITSALRDTAPPAVAHHLVR